MYSRIDEAVGISNGWVREAFWRFSFLCVLCNSHVGVREYGRSIGQGLKSGVAFVELGA